MLYIAHECICQDQKSLLVFKLTDRSPIRQDWHFKVNWTVLWTLPLHLYPYLSTPQLKAIVSAHVFKLSILMTTLIPFPDTPNSCISWYLLLASKTSGIQLSLTTSIAFVLSYLDNRTGQLDWLWTMTYCFCLLTSINALPSIYLNTVFKWYFSKETTPWSSSSYKTPLACCASGERLRFPEFSYYSTELIFTTLS